MSIYPLLFLFIALVEPVRFRGSCPLAHRSALKLPDKFPDSLFVLAPLSSASAADAPFFAKRIVGIGQVCETRLLKSGNQDFSFGYKAICYLLRGTIKPSRDGSSYEMIYEFGTQNKEPLQPECIRNNWTYENSVSIYTEGGVLLFWYCVNNRPEVGSHDAAMAAFVPADAEQKDFLTPIVNQLTFSKLLPRHFLLRSERNCSKTEQEIACPKIECPSEREGWRNNAGLVVWLMCFGLVSVVSSGVCGVIFRRRRVKEQKGRPRRIQVKSKEHVFLW